MQNKTDEMRCTKIRWANDMNWTKLKRTNEIRWSDEIGLSEGRTVFNCRLTRSRPTKTNNIEQYLQQCYKQLKSLNSIPNGVKQYSEQ